MPIYEYCKHMHPTPFIDFNEKKGITLKYKDDFMIGKDGMHNCSFIISIPMNIHE